MPEPQWSQVIQKGLDKLTPSIHGVNSAMNKFESTITIVDRVAGGFVHTLQTIDKTFSGSGITNALKDYESYLTVINKSNKQTIAYAQGIDSLNARYAKLTKETNLSKREISDLQAIAEKSIIGRRDFSAIDGQISRLNKFSASVKELHENFVNLIQAQNKFGVGFRGGAGGGAILSRLTTSELAGMDRGQFFSAAQDAFLGGRRQDTRESSYLKQFQRNRKDYENNYLKQLEKATPSAFNVSDWMRGFKVGENPDTANSLAAGIGAGGAVLGGIGSLGALYNILRFAYNPAGTLGLGGSTAAATSTARAAANSGKMMNTIEMMSAMGGAGGETFISPGFSGPSAAKNFLGNAKSFLGKGAKNFGIYGLGSMAIGGLTNYIVDKSDISDPMKQGAKSAIGGATTGAAIGSIFGLPGALAGGVAGGLYGLYQQYGKKGPSQNKDDVAQKDRIAQLEGQITEELMAQELNYDKITSLVKQYNGLVKGSGQELNENLAVVMSLKDNIDNISVIQGRINNILERQSSSYQELSQVYGEGLRVGKLGQEFALAGLKSQEEQLIMDRDIFAEKMKLQQQLEKRIKQGDDSAKKQMLEQQDLMQKKYNMNFNAQDILAKEAEIQAKLAGIQSNRIELVTREADINEQNQDVFVSQARTVTSISQSLKLGVLPEMSAIVNQVSAVNDKIAIQEQGYVNIQQALGQVNAEIMQMQRSGIDTAQKQEQIQLKMAERNKLQLKGEQQVNKILEARSDQLSSLLTLREKYLTALPAMGVGGMEYEVSFDQNTDILFGAPNQFLGSTQPGTGGLRYSSGGVNAMGGMMMGRGPSGFGIQSPLAYGAMPGQETMARTGAAMFKYDDDGDPRNQVVGQREKVTSGGHIPVLAKPGEIVIDPKKQRTPEEINFLFGMEPVPMISTDLDRYKYAGRLVDNTSKRDERDMILIRSALKNNTVHLLPPVLKARLDRLRSGARVGEINAKSSAASEQATKISPMPILSDRGLAIQSQLARNLAGQYLYHAGLPGASRFNPEFLQAHSTDGGGFTNARARRMYGGGLKTLNNLLMGSISTAGGATPISQMDGFGGAEWDAAQEGSYKQYGTRPKNSYEGHSVFSGQISGANRQSAFASGGRVGSIDDFRAVGPQQITAPHTFMRNNFTPGHALFGDQRSPVFSPVGPGLVNGRVDVAVVQNGELRATWNTVAATRDTMRQQNAIHTQVSGDGRDGI